MSFGITAIDHVQIAVPRALEAECLAFYRDVLGLAEIGKPAELQARGGAWFQLGSLQVHVGLDAEPSPASKRHICFIVTDIGTARTRAEALGLVIEQQNATAGLQRFFIRDPAGNRFEIGQR